MSELDVLDDELVKWFDEYRDQVAYDLEWGLMKLRSTPVLMLRGKRWRLRRGLLRRVDVYYRVGGKWAAFGAGYAGDDPREHTLFFVSDQNLRGYLVTSTKKGQVIKLADPPKSERELLFWINGYRFLRRDPLDRADEYCAYSRVSG